MDQMGANGKVHRVMAGKNILYVQVRIIDLGLFGKLVWFNLGQWSFNGRKYS